MVYCIFTRPLFIMNFLHKVYSKSHVWPVHSSFWSLLVALSILPFILPHFPLLDGPMIVYGSSLSPPFLNLFHLCQPPSFNLCLLLKLEKHITSLTGSWASFILCFCTMSFSVHPSTSPSLMFLSFSPFLFGMLHFVAPHLFYSLHFFFSHILLFLTSPQGLSSSSLPIWTSRPLPISSALFLKNEEWNRSFFSSFHHFPPLVFPFCPPCGNATTYSSSLQVPFKLLIRRGSEIL